MSLMHMYFFFNQVIKAAFIQPLVIKAAFIQPLLLVNQVIKAELETELETEFWKSKY